MAKSKHDVQLKELKDLVKELRATIVELNKTLSESRKREAVLQEQVDFLTKKSSDHPVKKEVHRSKDSLDCSMKLRLSRIPVFWKDS